MKRGFRTSLALCLTTVALGAMAPGASAAPPDPRADYRFNENLRSSVNGGVVPRLQKVGDPAEYEFGSNRIHGKVRHFLKFAEGAGLRLPTAKEAIGSGGDYTIAMLVRLNNIDSYRKLVDLNNLKTDEGWYEYSGYINPYDVSGIEEPDPLPIEEDKWHFIVMTRDNGNVKGYVDGERFFTEPDEGQEVLGPDEILHFVMDDVATTGEESGGRIARLMIWRNPLTNHQANNINY